MHGHIDDGAGGIAHGLVALVEAARGFEPINQIFRDRRAGFPVPRMFAQHFALGHPMLEHL